MNSDQELKLHAQQTKGGAAEYELALTREAFAKLRDEYIKAWTNSDPRDAAGREKIWTAMTVLSQVEKHLRTCVDNGTVAKKELDALRRAGEPKKKILGLV